MTGVWGWLDRKGGPGDEARLARLGTPSLGDETRHASLGHGAALDTDAPSHFHTADGLLVAYAGHPRLRGTEATGETGPARMVEAYHRHGRDLPSHLEGPFALAILEPVRQRGLLAVDRMGIHDLAYAPTTDGLLFGPRADHIAADPRCSGELDPQALYDYLYFHVIPRPATAFTGVHRLRPGEALWYAEGQAETYRYWRPHFEEGDAAPLATLKTRFRRSLQAAVGRAAEGGSVGAFLSGGTDSSTVCGLLGEVTGTAPRTYAIGFDAPGYDETGFARIAARHFGTRHREYFVTPRDVAAAVPYIAAGYDQPYGNASAVPTYYCAQLARQDGVHHLLGGDGGDELFAGNARYAEQWLLSLYEQVPRWLRQSLVEPVAGAFPFGEGIPPVRKARRYIEQANAALPGRLQRYNLVERMGPERIFTDGFRARTDESHPRSLLEAEYRPYRGYALVNRLLALDMKFTLADDDLRKVVGAAGLAGVETRFPFLDPEVVAMAATVPPGLKLKRTRLRYFFKEALRDLLPPEILDKEKHGFGLPFGVWMRENRELHELAGDSLSDLRGRDIVRPELLDALLDVHLQEHAGYYGTLVWVLMMLEQWLGSAPASRVAEPRPFSLAVPDVRRGA